MKNLTSDIGRLTPSKRENIIRLLELPLQNVAECPERINTPISTIEEAVSIPEQQQIIAWGEGKTVSYPEDTLCKLIQRSVRHYPNHIALRKDNDEALSYAELDRLVNQYAALLMQKIKLNDLVVVYLEKSFEFIITILAIHRIGATYVPVDTKQPNARLEQILVDTHANAIITREQYFVANSSLRNLVFFDLDVLQIAGASQQLTEHVHAAKPQDLAYVIYTSGTTGKPKGVKVSHAAAAGFIQEIIQQFAITDQDRVLQFASVGFDMSVFEIFSTLAAGATLFIMNDEERYLPEKINAFVEKHQITLADIPPVLLPLLDPSYFNSLRLLSVGSEKFLTKILLPWFNGKRRIVNGYGPTEATVMMSLYEYHGEPSVTPPIGKPIQNTQAYVLDKNHELLPIGATGELYIGGNGLAEGYMNDPSLTAEYFLTIAILGKKCRVYKTGDYVRWRKDGNLEIFERQDRQVKIKGHRIELSEIEAAILEHPKIKQVSVSSMADQQSNKILIAYLVFHPGQVETNVELQQFLAKKLPAYMIPSRYIILDALPYDHNGKLAVIKRWQDTVDENNGLITILKKFVDITVVGVDDNLFHHGLDSLSSAQIVAEVKRRFECNLNTADFYKSPTLKTLLASVGSQQKEMKQYKTDVEKTINHLKKLWLIPLAETNRAPINIIFFHCAGGSAVLNKTWSFQLNSNVLNVYNVQLPGHDARMDETPYSNLHELALYLAEEIKSIFAKPVIFVGHSMGALLAYETALVLKRHHHHISHLVVVASRPPHMQENRHSDHNLVERMKNYGGLSSDFFNNPVVQSKFMPVIQADAIASDNYYQEQTLENALQVPITAIIGTDDKTLTKEATMQWISFTTSKFSLMSLPAGHFVMLDAQDEFVKILNEIAMHYEQK